MEIIVLGVLHSWAKNTIWTSQCLYVCLRQLFLEEWQPARPGSLLRINGAMIRNNKNRSHCWNKMLLNYYFWTHHWNKNDVGWENNLRDMAWKTPLGCRFTPRISACQSCYICIVGLYISLFVSLSVAPHKKYSLAWNALIHFVNRCSEPHRFACAVYKTQ